MDRNHIAVIDFGSQYTQLIVRRIRELGYFSKLYQPRELNDCGAPAASRRKTRRTLISTCCAP
jgi:GMP synthase (glutamine-hydrolysing)